MATTPASMHQRAIHFPAFALLLLRDNCLSLIGKRTLLHRRPLPAEVGKQAPLFLVTHNAVVHPTNAAGGNCSLPQGKLVAIGIVLVFFESSQVAKAPRVQRFIPDNRPQSIAPRKQRNAVQDKFEMPLLSLINYGELQALDQWSNDQFTVPGRQHHPAHERPDGPRRQSNRHSTIRLSIRILLYELERSVPVTDRAQQGYD